MIFHINVENADLHKLKLVRIPFQFFEMSLFRSWNTIENLEGNIYIKEISYETILTVLMTLI
jgi:hypothetical protein